MIAVRPARPDDLALIERLIRELAEYEKLAGEVRSTSELLREHLFGPAPKAEVLIGEIDGEPRGFALFFGTFSTFEGRPGLGLEDLFVEPEARGRGLGKALLGALAQTAAERGCARLEWNVLDWNAPSIAFYDSLGARPNAGWIGYRLHGEALAALAAQSPPLAAQGVHNRSPTG
jgi:GNAT superfamily N-acetyltransferase